MFDIKRESLLKTTRNYVMNSRIRYDFQISSDSSANCQINKLRNLYNVLVDER